MTILNNSIELCELVYEYRELQKKVKTAGDARLEVLDALEAVYARIEKVFTAQGGDPDDLDSLLGTQE